MSAKWSCFYCGCKMEAHGKGVTKPHWVTRDHVIPQISHRLRDMPAVWQAKNVVRCCFACSQYKGRLRPLDWLVIMPSNDGATRLGNLLMDLGCDINDVSAAMVRRKK